MTSYEEAYAYLERHVDALKTNRTGDERQTDAEVFDKKTLLTIYDMMTSGYIDLVHYPVSTGKEGNVFYVTDEDGEGFALKIFRTSTSTFKRVSKYVEGDPRFRGVTGNRSTPGSTRSSRTSPGTPMPGSRYRSRSRSLRTACSWSSSATSRDRAPS